VVDELRRCRRKGRWLRSRDEWWLWLVHARGFCFGFSYDRVRRELVLILGCRLLEISAPGFPLSFVGGLHLMLNFDRCFSFSRS